MGWCRVLQPEQGCLAPSPAPLGTALRPGAPAASCAERAGGARMHTCSASALAEAWRARGCLAFVGQPHHQSCGGAPSPCRNAAPLSHRVVVPLDGRGWMWLCPPCLLRLGQVVHAARDGPALDQGLTEAGEGREMRGYGRTLFIKFRPAVSPLCVYIFQ